MLREWSKKHQLRSHPQMSCLVPLRSPAPLADPARFGASLLIGTL
jgi:hypothetical protein